MDDTPSLLTYYHLQPWLQGNLAHIDIDFNFDDVPHNNFQARLELMLDAFETGDLQQYVYLLVGLSYQYWSFRLDGQSFLSWLQVTRIQGVVTYILDQIMLAQFLPMKYGVSIIYLL